MVLKKSSEKGFTLSELLIVLAILAVLAAVVMIAITGMFSRGSDEALETETAIIQTAVTLFNWDTHRGPADGSWGVGSLDHYYPTDDGHPGTLTRASFPLPAGDTNPASALDGIIWMGLLANLPGDTGGDTPAEASPQSDEKGPYVNEIPQSASIYNGSQSNSGPYTWIILSDGTVSAVELAANTWALMGDGPVPPPLPPAPPVPTTCTLTLSSTDGGSATSPGEGVFFFPEGTVVDLLAVPDTCREFVGWTGDIDTVANIDVSDTTIIMFGDHSIDANFAAPEFVKVNIQIDPEVGAWIRIQDKATGDWAIDKYGVTVNGANHQTPTDIWIPWGDYSIRVKKGNWIFTVELPLIDESTCSVTLEIEK